MKKTTRSARPALAAAAAAYAAALLLAACGGDGYDGGAPAEDPTRVPTSATSSTSAWFMFARALALAPGDDTSEPLLLTGITEMPTSETEAAAAVDP